MSVTLDSSVEEDWEIRRSNPIKDRALVEKRRRQILDAALKLFLKKGIKATTIREICAESGVNRASLYDYVKNKADIVRIILQEMHSRNPEKPLQDALSKAQKLGLDPIREYLNALISYAWSRNRESIVLTYRETYALDKETQQRLLQKDSDLVKKVKHNLLEIGNLKNGDDFRLEIIANLIVFVNAFIPLRGWNMKDHPDEKVLETIVDLFTDILVEKH